MGLHMVRKFKLTIYADAVVCSSSKPEVSMKELTKVWEFVRLSGKSREIDNDGSLYWDRVEISKSKMVRYLGVLLSKEVWDSVGDNIILILKTMEKHLIDGLR